MADAHKQQALLGKYKLLKLIEEGVGGCLYQARHTGTDKAAVVKVIAPMLTRSVAFGKYLYDAWADQQALIEHPNVLHVWDVGKQGELQYVAVEDVGGESLSVRMQSAPLEVDEAMGILHQVAEGLRAAHRRDVVQGHLKPSDIILTTDEMGRRLVKVIFFDMGVSAQDTMAPVFGELLGTPKYMAPEVIRGRLPSPESDVFSLGIIAYEMLTGKEPFPSDNTVGYLFANCNEDPEPADQVREGLPHEVALVLARMLEKEPTRRYRSMQRVMDDLDRCVASARTGRVEVVPYGTDSAFARDYEMTRPKEERPAGARPASARPAGAGSRWLLLGAVVVAVAGLIVLAKYKPGPGEGKAAGLSASQGTVAAAPQGPALTPGPVTATRPAEGQTPQPTPADPAQEALDKATASWARHQQLRDYELGVTAFSDVVSRFPDTPAAAEASRQIGQLYTEWGRYLSDQSDYAGAVEKYKKAIETWPADSHFVELARNALPATLVRWAEAEQGRGNYARALELYQETARDYPATMEGKLLEQRRPELLLNNAFTLWKDKKDYDAAVGGFAQVVKEYPGTDWATKAQAALPDLYLEAVRQKLDQGKLPEARRQLEQLAEAYPDQNVAQKAQELDAELLFGLFKQAADAKDPSKADESYGELLQRYPASPWAVRAIRLRLGLERVAGEPTFSVSTARAQLTQAKKSYDAFDYDQAAETLKSVLRYAKAESQEAAEALALLPAWAYESALSSYGKGLPVECKSKLADVSAQFPNTVWSARAAQTLKNIEDAPQGMAYVPEGRFEMGTDMATITKIIGDQHIEAVSNDPEALKMAAQLYGLAGETPEHTATTGACYVDKTEVTNQQYREFLDATGYAAPAQWKDGAYPEGQGDFPVVGVTLADAQRYAEWRGCRLPTETEWEKAARGTDGRRFPWGDSWQDNRARHMQPATAGPLAVGSFPAWASPYGCLDMIGNVQEWTTSDFVPYEGSLMEGPPVTGLKVTRGGAWQQPELVPIPSSCASRYPVDPAMSYLALGFRCVKDAPTAKGPAAMP